jgi:hypothetical protein
MKRSKPFIIILVIIISFFFSIWLTNNVFITNTPRLNPLFIAKLKSAPGYIASIPKLIQNAISSKSQNQIAKNEPSSNQTANNSPRPKYETIQLSQTMSTMPKVTPPASAVFKSVSKGVYAAEGSNNSKYIKIEKGTPVEVRVYHITMPDGTSKEVQFIIPQTQ